MDPGLLAGKTLGATESGPPVLGNMELWVDNQVVDLTNLAKAQIQFQGIKAKAIAAGTYEGKSLDWLGGGRSRMLYDQLRVEGYDDMMSKKVVADNFQRQVKQVMVSGTPMQQAKVKAFYANYHRNVGG
jgi:hypothetical protein